MDRDSLRFNPTIYTIKRKKYGEVTITYRAFEGIPYCAFPADPIQTLNLFVPEMYYHGGTLHGYDLRSAPIFAPNAVGGYLPGLAEEPGWNRQNNRPNSIFAALAHGYVVASGGVRGRTSGTVSKEFFAGSAEKMQDQGDATGRMVGRAPAFIVDMKAIIRYLRHNKDIIPGNTERIITNGTSAGGALSALAGATGNCPDYEPYLREIGAADERDDVFAASCYCPIHNLENADAAYEWLFCGQDDYFRMRIQKAEDGLRFIPESGTMTKRQVQMSKDLKALFPSYVNRLGLKPMKCMQGSGFLALDADGNGSFRDYVGAFITESAQRERETHETAENLPELAVRGSEIETQDYLINDAEGRAKDLEWDGFASKITRMKTAPAFDAVDLTSPENEEFGDETVAARHFSEYSFTHSEVRGEMADEKIIRLMNPVPHISRDDTARYWRIRHGAFDRDTSLAIPVILATVLDNKGYDVDFRLPWGLPHSGDYDLAELFAWIDDIARNENV